MAARRCFDVDGGRLAGAILDRHNCLNVNALYSGADQRDADAAAAERFRLLFSALDLPLADSESLIAQAADWIDPDASVRPGGAEDYMTRDGQRRLAANQPLTELAELRALPVMTPALFARIEPFVCVFTDAGPAAAEPQHAAHRTERPDHGDDRWLYQSCRGGGRDFPAAELGLFKHGTGLARSRLCSA